MTNSTARFAMMATASLIPGQDHPALAVNLRRTDRDVALGELIASIESDGVLEPLLVWVDDERDGRAYIVNGSRRHAAVLKIMEKGKDKGEGGTTAPSAFETLPCMVRSGGEASDALAWSIATIMTPLPAHEVDQFEAFAQLDKSMAKTVPVLTPVERAGSIAVRYGISARVVEQRLALGNRAPEVLKAWRAGEITCDVAQAFTLEPDKKPVCWRKCHKPSPSITAAFRCYRLLPLFRGF